MRSRDDAEDQTPTEATPPECIIGAGPESTPLQSAAARATLDVYNADGVYVASRPLQRCSAGHWHVLGTVGLWPADTVVVYLPRLLPPAAHATNLAVVEDPARAADGDA